MRLWFRKKKPLNLEVHNTRLRLDEYRTEPALVSIAQKLLADPDLRLMLQVVANEHPGYQVFNPTVPEHVRAAHQAKGEGYTLFLSNLEALAVPFKNAVIAQPTYENEELEKA